MKKVIWLRIYRGTEILKKENGEVKNENSKVALTHNTLEWSLFLKSLPANPFCKVDVEKAFELKEGKYVECDIDDSIKKEVEFAHKGDQTVKLNADQQRIADLEAKLEAFMKKDDIIKEKIEIIKLTKDEVFTGENDLDDLKAQYKQQEGKEVPNNKKNDKKWIKNKLTK